MGSWIFDFDQLKIHQNDLIISSMLSNMYP